MVKKESIKITKLEGNVGQIPDVPANPRYINKDRFEALCRSIEQAPEMLELREAIVYPHKKKFVVICGNMRLKACRKLGFETMPCKILPQETTAAKIAKKFPNGGKIYVNVAEKKAYDEAGNGKSIF